MEGFWDQYDKDKNGTLDKEEFKEFLTETYGSSSGESIDLKFEEVF